MTLARTLLAADLVDEIELVIFPVVAGRGRRLFSDEGANAHLELVNVHSTPSGVLLVSYRAAPRAPAPSA